VEESFWKRLWTCRLTDYWWMNELQLAELISKKPVRRRKRFSVWPCWTVGDLKNAEIKSRISKNCFNFFTTRASLSCTRTVYTTTEQNTLMLLFFLTFKRTTRKFTLSQFSSQFQWSPSKQILTIKHAIREDRDAYCSELPTFTTEKGQLYWQTSFKLSAPYAVFSHL
jgi:hypothetical protein